MSVKIETSDYTIDLDLLGKFFITMECVWLHLIGH
jgi:hypothetical protein